jgi:hypothetical protein
MTRSGRGVLISESEPYWGDVPRMRDRVVLIPKSASNKGRCRAAADDSNFFNMPRVTKTVIIFPKNFLLTESLNKKYFINLVSCVSNS